MAAKGGKKDEKYTGTFDQNMRIRDRILKNDIIPVPDYKEAIKSFSPEKQKIIQNSFQ